VEAKAGPARNAAIAAPKPQTDRFLILVLLPRKMIANYRGIARLSASVRTLIQSAYGAGADFVMLGGMLAGHDECDGEIRYAERGGEKVPIGMTFYGMSPETAMRKHSGGVAHYRAAEGKTVETPYRGSVDGTMAEIMGGVRSMMTYIGAAHLKEVSKRTTFVRVSAQTNDVFGQ
jgi:GMP reductase